MLSASEWRKHQPNTIDFVLVDGNGLEVLGVGPGFSLYIAKATGTFVPGSGLKSEIGMGWYRYTATAGEADTSGPVAIVVQAFSSIQQNLEYVVDDRVVAAREYTYTVTSTAGNLPLSGVETNIFADPMGNDLVWSGMTDVFGIAVDFYGNLPRLQPGAYYFFRRKDGYSFSDPDVETVS